LTDPERGSGSLLSALQLLSALWHAMEENKIWLIQFQKCLFKKNRTGIDKFGIEVCYKKFNPQINLPFNFFNSEIFLP